jgi:hypothetical protein
VQSLRTLPQPLAEKQYQENKTGPVRLAPHENVQKDRHCAQINFGASAVSPAAIAVLCHPSYEQPWHQRSDCICFDDHMPNAMCRITERGSDQTIGQRLARNPRIDGVGTWSQPFVKRAKSAWV